MGDTFREIDGMPLRWDSPDGLIHAVEGAQIVPNDINTRLLWTFCGQHDVPANCGYKSRDEVTCLDCLVAQENSTHD